jgi:hypothetical protein
MEGDKNMAEKPLQPIPPRKDLERRRILCPVFKE